LHSTSAFRYGSGVILRVILWCHCFCWWLEELPPPLPWPTYKCAYWSLEAPHHDHPCDLSCVQSMPKHKRRLRGKPRRGSPWRPRRPSFFSHDMPPSAPSLHLQEAQPSQHSSSSADCKLQFPGSDSSVAMLFSAFTPRSSGTEPHSTQRSAFPRALGEEPPPPTRVPGSSGIPPFDATTGEQVKDKLAILYGLVFELRQGVEDLQFRLQLSNDKVTLFLQLLSSLHETFLSTPEEATFKQAPDADTADGEAKESATSTQGHRAQLPRLEMW
jgi:hypothetical protein